MWVMFPFQFRLTAQVRFEIILMKIYRNYLYFVFFLIISFTLVFSFVVSAKEFSVSELRLIETDKNSFSGVKSFDFIVSGGDVIASSTPIVAYVSVEGLYEGGGSVTAYFDGNMDTAETFLLPDVGEPETMHFVLGDKLGVLRSSEAGEYSHQLFLAPSGVALSSVSANVQTSYGRDVGNKCPEGQSTSIKLKTIEMWVGNTGAMSSPQTYTINYSIDDDTTGIADPIESAYVEVIGLHKGSGIIDIYFDNESLDGVSHELKSVKKQKQFDVISKDIKNLIEALAGTGYTKEVTIDPNGLNIENVSLKFYLTYKYHPSALSCGGYPPTGEYSSPVLDTRTPSSVVYNSIGWRGVLGGVMANEGKVKFQLATAPCNNGSTNPPTCNLGTWKYIGGTTCSITDWFETKGPSSPYNLFNSGCSQMLDGNQYYRYKVQICAKDCVDIGENTPEVDEIYVSWSP